MTVERRRRLVALVLILVVALAWRLNNIGFGLPSMWDPDEPIFMLIPLDMVTDHTLDPGWFGHPGSTTIYLIAAIEGAVAAAGLLTGLYPNAPAFAHAAFENPAMLFIPARLAMVLIGVAVVWLTYLVGRRLKGTAVGLVAAFLLAVNGLHIAWSQVVRTDIHASLFMMACIFFSIRASEDGRLRNYILASAFAGFATATKWPAITVLISVAGAAASRGLKGREPRNLAIAAVAFLTAIFVASPFIYIDWQTVLSNVQGEAKPFHLAHTGAGFFGNLRFYLIDQVGSTVGWIGLAAVFLGAALLAKESRPARFILLSITAGFLALICTQHLIWSRWVLPVLPTLCICAATAVAWLGNVASRAIPRLRPALAVGIMATLIAVPSVAGAVRQANERANDTRGQAARWAARHIPPGSTVVLEHLEISLRHEPWTFLFPIGSAGCIDGLRALDTGIKYKSFQQVRGQSPIVDLGNVSPNRIDTCHADFAILTYYDLYRAEAQRYPKEIKTYDRVLAGGRTIALFAPAPGRAGGPIVRIVALPQH